MRFSLPAVHRARGTGAAGILVEVDADELAAFLPGKAFLQLLIGGAAIGVGLRLMHEHSLAPEAARLSRRCVGLGHHRDDASFGAGADLLALIIPTISQGDHFGGAGLGLCGSGHLQQVRAVMPAVGHRIRDDDVVLGIDGCLHIVTDDAAMIAAGRHGAGIRIGQRYLLIGSRLQLPANLLELAKPTTQ